MCIRDSDEVSLDGLGTAEAKARITAYLQDKGIGRGTVNYRLRDWLFSRQRYWGEPFPVVWDEDGVAHALPDSMLPLTLPDVPDYSPKTYDPDDSGSEPEPPLSRVAEWVNVELDLGDGRGVRRFRRETNTMPNWAGSCWYYLRYLDPANGDALVDPENERYWVGPQATPVPGAPAGTRDPGGVDLYVGGVEHAVLHLLYARFWHKVLFDLGHLSSEEPFRTYFSQGYIQAPAFTDERGQYVPADEVIETPGAHGAEPTFTWDGQPVRRETNTMPNWAGSCWYYLRYLDPTNSEALVDPANERYWIGPQANPVPGAPAGTRDPGGVDLYVGGVEHAVLHLLYARFWHKVLFDLGHLSSEEPFRTYFSQGYIQAPAFTDERGQYVQAEEVVETPGVHGAEATFTWQGQPVKREFGKIGKSLKNMVSPDEMYAVYGADTFRIYEMSMGPLELSKPWETRAVVGSARFLQRLWRNVVDEITGECRGVELAETDLEPALRTLLHKTIAGVREDYAGLRFNTAIAKLIELNNAVTKLPAPPRSLVEPLVQMVAPVAPHIADELWERMGRSGSLALGPFPVADLALLVEDTVTCVIQIKGKVRDRVDVPADISESDLRELVLAREKVLAATADGIRTVIVRPPSLVNVVPM